MIYGRREPNSPTGRDGGGRTLLVVGLKTLSLYSFAGWAYIAMNAIFHPDTLRLPVSHLLPWPHEDTFGAVCFVISAASFFCLQLVNRTGRAKGDQ
jgi:hypothetical protein